MVRRRQASERPEGGKALAKKLWPASLPSALWGLLKILGATDSIAFVLSLGGGLRAVQAFLETSLGAMCLAASLLWAAYILFDADRKRWAVAFLSLGIFAVALSAFFLGQQVPPPNVQLKYFDPFLLDKTNRPIARVSDGLVEIPVLATGFTPYLDNYRVAAACRPAVPGRPLEGDDDVQLGMFQPVERPKILELRLATSFIDKLCKHTPPAMHCGILMVKKDIAVRFNREMKAYRAEDLGKEPFPSIGFKDIAHSIFQERKIAIEGCPSNDDR